MPWLIRFLILQFALGVVVGMALLAGLCVMEGGLVAQVMAGPVRSLALFSALCGGVLPFAMGFTATALEMECRTG